MPTTRQIQLLPRTGAQLLDELRAAGVELNAMALQLLTHQVFAEPLAEQSVVTVELSARELGLHNGARMGDIIARAAQRGLVPCPVQTGPFLRLAYLDQPDGALGQPVTQHCAPPGSLTVISLPVVADDTFPKGFYLRCIAGKQWLRGFTADAEHVYDADDRLVLCER